MSSPNLRSNLTTFLLGALTVLALGAARAPVSSSPPGVSGGAKLYQLRTVSGETLNLRTGDSIGDTMPVEVVSTQGNWVELKSPGIPRGPIWVNFDQIARYNLVTKATYLMVTNGLEHYYCRMDYENERYVFLEEIPERA